MEFLYKVDCSSRIFYKGYEIKTKLVVLNYTWRKETYHCMTIFENERSLTLNREFKSHRTNVKSTAKGRPAVSRNFSTSTGTFNSSLSLSSNPIITCESRYVTVHHHHHHYNHNQRLDQQCHQHLHRHHQHHRHQGVSLDANVNSTSLNISKNLNL
jgi:hypothetical protein